MTSSIENHVEAFVPNLLEKIVIDATLAIGSGFAVAVAFFAYYQLGRV